MTEASKDFLLILKNAGVERTLIELCERLFEDEYENGYDNGREAQREADMDDWKEEH
jgi:hypothetical protein